MCFYKALPFFLTFSNNFLNSAESCCEKFSKVLTNMLAVSLSNEAEDLIVKFFSMFVLLMLLESMKRIENIKLSLKKLSGF
ncbi:hypothetical protein MCY_00938 [Bartonella rattimassiliensis 15908]|uniref:Uncharacterized protein n=1 Tax=Bartonella rattimassiliensis 15908 TaxID=1094556 RepID=J0QS98_9HYPH|nr:hypothetical protein MCY_00938 [Bartonella rattimassiliensis 15908]